MNHNKAFLSLSVAISLIVSGCGNSNEKKNSQALNQKATLSPTSQQTTESQIHYPPIANPDAPSGLWDMKISVCGDVSHKKPGEDCFIIKQKVWGEVGDAKLYYQTGLYKIAVYSSGCLSYFAKPQIPKYYSTEECFYHEQAFTY
ncbi:MAG: hypothetical protein H0X31_00335 [Nostocaceae cyanobacterium]|nr:hypothetical protein [Nostocaceae cyanobacterium]